MRRFPRVLLEIAPDLWMAAVFAFAAWAPNSRWATSAADCRTIMLLEGVFIVCSALVGVYLRIAVVFFPILVLGGLGWLLSRGFAGLDFGTASFSGYLVLAFFEGIKAHKGAYGMARTNPSHPHRRYDRMFLLFVSTGLVALGIRFLGEPKAWSLWGTAYFCLLASVNTFLQSSFDSLPKAMLKRMKSGSHDEVHALVGVCASCVYVQPAIPARRRRYIRCALSTTDARFREYPVTPVRVCEGHSPATGSPSGASIRH